MQIDDGLRQQALSGSDAGVASYLLVQPLGKGGVGSLRVVTQPAAHDCTLASATPATPAGQAGPIPTVDMRCRALKLGYSLRSGGLIDVWAVHDDDSLQRLDAATQTSVDGARALAVAKQPTHSLLYVAGKDEIQVFQVQPGASLKKFTSYPLQPGSDPVALAVHPDGNMLFLACQGNYQVQAFWINTGTGALQSLGAVSTLTPDATLPRMGLDAKSVKGARLDARPTRLLASPAGDMLYVGDADGRIEAFSIRVPGGSSNAGALPGQIATPTQSSNLSLLAQARPFQDGQGLSMVCDDGCKHLLLAQPSNSQLTALPAPAAKPGKPWNAQTLSLGGSPPPVQALAFDTATSTLYVASHLGSASMIAQYAYAASGDTISATPLMTPTTARAEQSAYTSLRVAGDARAVYAIDPSSNAVWQFDVDVVDGTASPGKPGAGVLRGQLTPMGTPGVTTPAATLELELEP